MRRKVVVREGEGEKDDVVPHVCMPAQQYEHFLRERVCRCADLFLCWLASVALHFRASSCERVDKKA